MESETYFFSKNAKASPQTIHENWPSILFASKDQVLTETQIKQGLYNDLKKVLDSDLVQASRQILELEELLVDNFEYQSIEKIFVKLSPIILRSFIESETQALSEKEREQIWLESLRVAIEDELYLLKEELESSKNQY